MVSPGPGWMHACMYICMYVRWKWKGVPYHLWAKIVVSGAPPPLLLEAQKHVGGYISCGQVKYFWEISCPNPLNIPELKGGMPKRSKTKLALVL